MVKDLDPVTFAVVRNGLISAVNEMYWVFKRTTMLPILYEYNDFGCSIYDNRLNLIAEAPGLPIFVGSLDDLIEKTIAEIGGVEQLEPGDVLINNHPYLTAGQPADTGFIEPVYHEGELVAFTVLRAHVGDLGAMGIYPTNSTELVQEGTLFPALKLYRAGELNEDIIKIARANSRLPSETAGNFLAAGGALRAGSGPLLSLIEKYGTDTYYEVVDELLDHGERIARRGIEQIPDGAYECIDFLDDDGVREGEPVELRCVVTIDGDEMKVDLTGSAEQQVGPVNCPWGYTLSTCRFALKRLVSPEIPSNGGEHRPVSVVVEPGSIFDPTPPSPCFIGWISSLRLGDMIVNALAPAIPDVVPAPGGGDLMTTVCFLRQPTSGNWAFFWDEGGIGHGAKKGKDGMAALIHPICAGTELLPTELMESRMPITKWRHELVTDGGGAGEFRGGLPAVLELEVLSSGIAATVCDHREAAEIEGVRGGHGPPHKNEITFHPGTDDALHCGKRSDIPLSAGDRILSRPAGGAGYGDPRRRDPEQVAWDVLNEYCSRDSARVIYGVVVNDDFSVDVAATARLRSERGDSLDESASAEEQASTMVEDAL